jgi:hypothetical protein
MVQQHRDRPFSLTDSCRLTDRYGLVCPADGFRFAFAAAVSRLSMWNDRDYIQFRENAHLPVAASRTHGITDSLTIRNDGA